MPVRNLSRSLSADSRLTQAFGTNSQPLSGVRSGTQGINYALQELLAGLGIGEDRRNKAEFDAAIQKATVADPATVTKTNYQDLEEGGALADADPQEIKNPKARSLQQRLMAAAEDIPNNPIMAQFLQQSMLPHRLSRELATGDRDEKRAYDAQLLAGSRAYAEGQADKAHGRAVELKKVGAKPPTSIREYQYAMAQRKASGQPQMSFTDYEKMMGLAKYGVNWTPPVSAPAQVGSPGPQGAPGAPAGPQGAAAPPLSPRGAGAPQGGLPPLEGPPYGSASFVLGPVNPRSEQEPAARPPNMPPQAQAVQTGTPGQPGAITPPADLIPGSRADISAQTGTPGQPGATTPPTDLIPGSRADINAQRLGLQHQSAAAGTARAKTAADALKHKKAQDALTRFGKGHKSRLRDGNMARAGGTVVQDLQRLLTIVDNNWMASGFPAAMTSWFPSGSNPAYIANQLKSSIASNTGVNEIMQMKAASESGGGVGQVPVQQQIKFEQLLGSLDLGQGSEILADNIKRISNLWLDMIHGTPEEIQRRVGVVRTDRLRPDGTAYPVLTQKKADKLMIRQRLSFDEMGRPIKADLKDYPGVTEADIQATMTKRRLTRDEVFKALDKQQRGR